MLAVLKKQPLAKRQLPVEWCGKTASRGWVAKLPTDSDWSHKLHPEVDWGCKTAPEVDWSCETAFQLLLTGMHPCNDGSRRRLQVTERVLGVWLLASFCIWFRLVCLHLLGKLWFCEICSVGACFPGKDWLLKLGFAKLGSLLCL